MNSNTVIIVLGLFVFFGIAVTLIAFAKHALHKTKLPVYKHNDCEQAEHEERMRAKHKPPRTVSCHPPAYTERITVASIKKRVKVKKRN